MRYFVSIGHVDEETSINTVKNTALEAKKFLDGYDHEGSSVSVEVRCEDGEDSYKLLSWCMDGEVK